MRLIDPDIEHETEHRFLENDTGSDQDISEDEEFEDSIIDDTSNFYRFLFLRRVLTPNKQ